MRSPLSKIVSITLAAATTVVAQANPPGPITSADAAMRYHRGLEYPPVPQRLWGHAQALDDAASTATGWVAAPMPGPRPDASKVSAVAAAAQPEDRTAARTADMPYRFFGRSPTGAGTSIVLFGRGRVVTVQGPQALDDEYAVEAVFDDHLVLRHVPSGAGSFLPLTHRQRVHEPPRNPEHSPRD